MKADGSYCTEGFEEHADWILNKAHEYVSKIEGVDPELKIDQKYANEMVRASDTKIHTISAFLGGIASQEIIKILIKQYTIFNNTLIYDGIRGMLQVYE